MIYFTYIFHNAFERSFRETKSITLVQSIDTSFYTYSHARITG